MTFKGRMGKLLLCGLLIAFVCQAKFTFSDDRLAKAVDSKPMPTATANGNLISLREYVKGFVDREETPCIGILLTQKDRVVFQGAFGFADIDFEKPFREDSLVFLASSTKPVATTALMILVDEGHLSLDDPVSRYLPEFDSQPQKIGHPTRSPTIRHLLAHTSGWPGLKEMTPDAFMAIRDMDLTLKASVKKIIQEKRLAEPGKRFSYGGLSFNVAGRIVEVVSGLPFDRFIQERLFYPLGMRNTTFHPSPEQGEKVAAIFKPAPWGGFLNLVRYDPDKERNLLLIGGGLYSSARDMSIFLQMHLNGGVYGNHRILSTNAVREMQKHQIGDAELAYVPIGKMQSYGLGWMRERATDRDNALCVSHAGAFGSVIWIDNERQLTGVLFTPMPLKYAHEIHEKIRAKIREIFPM